MFSKNKNLIVLKGLSKPRIICALSWLLLSLTSKVAYAQETNCNNGHFNSSICRKNGIVNNNYTAKIPAETTYLGSYDPKARSSTDIFKKPKPTVVDAGNFQFKLLGCKSSQDKVQCDLTVVNLTSIDRTLFVASKQHGGIRNVALSQLAGETTLIDSNGHSYIAESISFAGKSEAETGQSYFTVYSDTTPKLSVIFTGVETPATIQRLDIVVGEYMKSENSVNLKILKYAVKPTLQS